MRRVGFALALLVSCVMAGQTALAADMRTKPVYKAPPKPAPFSWTGLYVGAHIGGGWNHNSWFDTGVLASIGSNTASGWLAGGQIGYNRQVGSWVFGVEGDAAWADLTGSHRDPVFSLIAPTGLEPTTSRPTSSPRSRRAPASSGTARCCT